MAEIRSGDNHRANALVITPSTVTLGIPGLALLIGALSGVLAGSTSVNAALALVATLLALIICVFCVCRVCSLEVLPYGVLGTVSGLATAVTNHQPGISLYGEPSFGAQFLNLLFALPYSVLDLAPLVSLLIALLLWLWRRRILGVGLFAVCDLAVYMPLDVVAYSIMKPDSQMQLTQVMQEVVSHPVLLFYLILATWNVVLHRKGAMVQ